MRTGQATTTDMRPRRSPISFLLFLMLVGNALACNLFGPLQNNIMTTCSMTLTQMGLLISVSQIASFVSCLVLPALSHRIGSYRMLIFGILGAAFGFGLMASSSTALMFSFSFLLQSMLSYFYSSANYAVLAECDPAHRNTNIPMMHLVYSIASVGGGFFITWTKNVGWQNGYWASMAMYIAGALLFLFRWKEAKANPSLVPQQRVKRVEKQRHSLFSGFSLLKRKEFIAFFIFLVCFTSIEYCVTIYPILFLEMSWLASAALTGFAVTAYWIGSTVARVALMPVLKKGINATLLLASLTGLCVVALVLLPLMPSLDSAIWIMPLAGFAFGALNPTSQIVEIRRWSEDMDQVANLHIISGVIGRLIFPILISYVGEMFGLRLGVGVLAVVMVIALFALLVSERLFRKSLLQDTTTIV